MFIINKYIYMTSCLIPVSLLDFKFHDQQHSTRSGDFAPHPWWTFGKSERTSLVAQTIKDLPAVQEIRV